MTLLYTDPIFLRHETGRHPERPDRLRAVTAALTQSGLLTRCQPGSFEPATLDDVRLVHTQEVAERVTRTAEIGGGYLDTDTVVCPDSPAAALAAVGACLAAVDSVLAGPETTAFCIIRPPGHHATPTQSMGFCLFNSVAVAARHALVRRGLSRVLVIDWDVHHGNGTQDIFYDDPQVTFFSIHRHGQGFYPGTGGTDQTGTGPGLGHTINAAVRYGTSRSGYLETFNYHLEKAADLCRPEIVILSAGFDAHALDPVGCLGLESEDFATLTDAVRRVAATHAHGRLVSCLEGGYNLNALGECAAVHLERLLVP